MGLFCIILSLFLIIIFFYIISLDNQFKNKCNELKKLEELNTQILNSTSSTVPLSKHNSEITSLLLEIDTKRNSLGILQEKYDKVISKQKSEQVRLGQISEKIIPFISGFPYDTDNIAALFMPIDLIVFSDSEIIFVEIKTGKAVLSEKQKLIKKLVNEKRVRFETHRLDNNGQYLIDENPIIELKKE